MTNKSKSARSLMMSLCRVDIDKALAKLVDMLAVPMDEVNCKKLVKTGFKRNAGEFSFKRGKVETMTRFAVNGVFAYMYIDYDYNIDLAMNMKNTRVDLEFYDAEE